MVGLDDAQEQWIASPHGQAGRDPHKVVVERLEAVELFVAFPRDEDHSVLLTRLLAPVDVVAVRFQSDI